MLELPYLALLSVIDRLQSPCLGYLPYPYLSNLFPPSPRPRARSSSNISNNKKKSRVQLLATQKKPPVALRRAIYQIPWNWPAAQHIYPLMGPERELFVEPVMQMRTPRVKLIIVAALSTPRPVLGSSRWSGKADRYILSTGNSRRKSLALRSSVAALLLGARATTRDSLGSKAARGRTSWRARFRYHGGKLVLMVVIDK